MFKKNSFFIFLFFYPLLFLNCGGDSSQGPTDSYPPQAIQSGGSPAIQTLINPLIFNNGWECREGTISPPAYVVFVNQQEFAADLTNYGQGVIWFDYEIIAPDTIRERAKRDLPGNYAESELKIQNNKLYWTDKVSSMECTPKSLVSLIPTSLAGTEWRLVEISGGPAIQKDQIVTINFDKFNNLIFKYLDPQVYPPPIENWKYFFTSIQDVIRINNSSQVASLLYGKFTLPSGAHDYQYSMPGGTKLELKQLTKGTIYTFALVSYFP